MEVRAISKYVRISPRKTRLVLNIVRGKEVNDSVQVLEAMNKRAARVVGKVLASAVASARQKELNIDGLWIKQATADGGPVYKRYMPRAMGRATTIRKPTSHITIVLSDAKKKSKLKKIEVQKVGKVDEKKESRLTKVRRKKAGKTKKKAGKKQKK